MGLKTWNNGEMGDAVKAIIEHNFKILNKHLSRNILSLSTKERELLSDDHLSNGLIVYDITLDTWFQYINNQWVEYPLGNGGSEDRSTYSLNISTRDWVNGTISIPYITHNVPSPMVWVFILIDNEYTPVFGGISVDNEDNITISSDMNFDGKVVIK